MQSRRNFLGIAKSYQRTLEKRPYLVQAIQAGILMGAGDICAQTFFNENQTANIDYIRTLKFCCVGFVLTVRTLHKRKKKKTITFLSIQGPCVRFWYGVMDKGIKTKSPLTKAMIKVGIDQIIFAPIFIALLVSTISYMQDQNVELIEHKLRTQYTDILISNYYVWPWAQIINFRFMPLNYQVLFTQTVAFLWNIYISWKTYSSDKVEKLS